MTKDPRHYGYVAFIAFVLVAISARFLHCPLESCSEEVNGWWESHKAQKVYHLWMAFLLLLTSGASLLSGFAAVKHSVSIRGWLLPWIIIVAISALHFLVSLVFILFGGDLPQVVL